jgi:hypothetical protein
MTVLTGPARTIQHLKKNLRHMEGLMAFATMPLYANTPPPVDPNERNAWLLCRLQSIIAASLSEDEQGG